jgi:methylglutaconyl-CoA hydratase
MTMADDLLLYERRGDAIWLTMNRPEIRNALASGLVQALRDGLQRAAGDADARAIVLAGAGRVFCAGADVNQYLDAVDRERVLEEGGRLYDFLEDMISCPKPVIARVQRAAFGGAIGLVCAADLVVADEDARFSLSEARLGLVPAVIGPSVVRALGPRMAQSVMLLAEPFSAAEAREIGMIHRVVPADQLDQAVDEWVGQIRANAPTALSDAKALVADLYNGRLSPAERRERSVTLAADRRICAEGQEGLSAFLEKRRPAWNPEA